MKTFTTLLSEPDPVVEGAGSILDFVDTLPRHYLTVSDEASDWWVMQGDWEDVGRDLRQALSLPRESGGNA